MSGAVVFAQGADLPSPGLTPDSPFYFLDTLGEKIGMFFAFSAEKKAEKAMQYAGEKLMEVKAMAEKNKIDALNKSGQKYQEYLILFFKKGGEASEEGKDISEMEKVSKLKALDYLRILSDTYKKITEEKVKNKIDELRNVSREAFGETIWSQHEKIMKELREEKMKEQSEKATKMLEILEKEGISAEAQEKVIALINGAEITKDEFIQKLRVYILGNKFQISRQDGMGQMAGETEDEFIQRLMPVFGKPVFEKMINEIIIQQKAEEQDVKAMPEEINEKIDEIKKQSGGEAIFKQKLSETGMTSEELMQQVEVQILIEKLVAKQAVISEQDIKDYFYRNKARFAKPEEVRASHILVRTEQEAKEVLSRLKAGADFIELAMEKSIDPGTKDKGGDLGFFSQGKMTPAFEQAAFALESGEISEVVKTPYGYHIIKVEEKKPAQEPNLELAREEIKETLTQQKIWTVRSDFLQNLREEAEIEIRLFELGD